jgi:hypothetical protein
MIIYLDNLSNRKGTANENYARELMELFTLGEGHYTEQDIKESARAFTGWHMNRQTEEFFLNQRLHDEGDKTFMGQTGNLNGDQIVEIILKRPEAAEYIVGKMWLEFISETPDPAEVKRLAKVFRDADYEIKPLVEALLLSPAFRDPANQGKLIKSPVDLLVGTVRTFDLPVRDADLLDPPNVKGWPGGESWIDSNTLLIRNQSLASIFENAKGQGRDSRGDERSPAMVAALAQSKNEKQAAPARKNAGPPLAQREGMMRLAMELRQQGLDRAAIAERLRAEGYDPAQLRAMAEGTAGRPALDSELRPLAQRAAQLRQQGMERQAIAQQLISEGYDRTQLEELGDRMRAANSDAGGAAMMMDGEMMGDSMMAAAPGGMMPVLGSSSPREAWASVLADKSDPLTTLKDLVLPMEPTAQPPAGGDPVAVVTALVLDPIYQLK